MKCNCLMPVLAAFIISQNASNDAKLLQKKSGAGRPRLVVVVYSRKCFRNDLIC